VTNADKRAAVESLLAAETDDDQRAYWRLVLWQLEIEAWDAPEGG
jgi:hypothetical protein